MDATVSSDSASAGWIAPSRLPQASVSATPLAVRPHTSEATRCVESNLPLSVGKAKPDPTFNPVRAVTAPAPSLVKRPSDGRERAGHRGSRDVQSRGPGPFKQHANSFGLNDLVDTNRCRASSSSATVASWSTRSRSPGADVDGLAAGSSMSQTWAAGSSRSGSRSPERGTEKEPLQGHIRTTKNTSSMATFPSDLRTDIPHEKSIGALRKSSQSKSASSLPFTCSNRATLERRRSTDSSRQGHEDAFLPEVLPPLPKGSVRRSKGPVWLTV